MVEMYSIPPLEEVERLADGYPSEWFPNRVPYAIVVEGALTDTECDDILECGMKLESYRIHAACGAETREWKFAPDHVNWIKLLQPISDFTRQVNDMYFNFEINDSHYAWLQTYGENDDYRMHTDSSLGQSRKLTSVILLSDPEEYDEGILKLMPIPYSFSVPRTRGTIVIFPSWILHEVTAVTRGVRQTINMGFWGPPFR